MSTSSESSTGGATGYGSVSNRGAGEALGSGLMRPSHLIEQNGRLLLEWPPQDQHLPREQARRKPPRWDARL